MSCGVISKLHQLQILIYLSIIFSRIILLTIRRPLEDNRTKGEIKAKHQGKSCKKPAVSEEV